MPRTSERPKLVIWGASSHALVVADIVRAEGRYEIVGFLDDVDPSRAGEAFDDATVLGGAEQLERLRANGVTHVVLGFYGSYEEREPAARRASGAGFELATAIHPSAVLAPSVTVGPGTVIHSGVVVEPHTRIGANAILNCVAGAGHECVIGDGVHLGGRASLAGKVTVGDGALLELNAMVARGVTVGAGAVVGSMALVLDDVPERVLVHGIPARVVREL